MTDAPAAATVRKIAHWIPTTVGGWQRPTLPAGKGKRIKARWLWRRRYHTTRPVVWKPFDPEEVAFLESQLRGRLVHHE